MKTEPFYVAIITPVIHYCMGGLEIVENSLVLDDRGAPIPGLYAAGEVAGGVHDNNRLGRNGTNVQAYEPVNPMIQTLDLEQGGIR